MFDLILKGGWVIDGSGGPPFRADVALLETMIAEVGRLEGARGISNHRRRRSLCRPRIHRRARPRRSHAAGRPDPLPALRQGVTTYLIGQDGSSFAPASPGDA